MYVPNKNSSADEKLNRKRNEKLEEHERVLYKIISLDHSKEIH